MLQCSETQQEHYEEAIESYDAYEPFNTSSKSIAVLYCINPTGAKLCMQILSGQ